MKKDVSCEEPVLVCNVLEEGRFGGPQSRVIMVAEALKKHGIETHVVHSQFGSKKLSEKLSEKGISCSAIRIIPLSKQGKTLVRYILCFVVEILLLYLLFKREKFDVIHVNGSYQIKGALAARMARIPIIWHLNDTSILMPIKKVFAFLARHCASGFICSGRRVYEYYISRSILENKPHINISPPVDIGLFDPEWVQGDKRIQEYQGTKIMTVCNINPVKGLEYFIEMALDLTQRHEKLYFFVVGPVYSSQRKYYENIKRLSVSKGLKNLVFLGKLDDVAPALKAADIYVFTSLSESGPMAVWEAMAMGKPIVTTNVGSVDEYVENGKSGFIVPIKDYKALSAKVETLLKDVSLRQKMGSEARAVAKEKLDVSTAAEKHAFFYREILRLQQIGAIFLFVVLFLGGVSFIK